MDPRHLPFFLKDLNLARMMYSCCNMCESWQMGYGERICKTWSPSQNRIFRIHRVSSPKWSMQHQQSTAMHSEVHQYHLLLPTTPTPSKQYQVVSKTPGMMRPGPSFQEYCYGLFLQLWLRPFIVHNAASLPCLRFGLGHLLLGGDQERQERRLWRFWMWRGGLRVGIARGREVMDEVGVMMID